MQDSNKKFSTPAGWHSVTPRIVVHDAFQFVEFLKHVFEATGEYVEERPAIIQIGDSKLMVNDAGVRDPTSAFLYVYVADTDAVYARALDAGAQTVEQPGPTPYGDRRCMVKDRWGNTWQIATYALLTSVDSLLGEAVGDRFLKRLKV